MDAKTISSGILRALATVLGIAVLGYFLYQIRFIVLYIAIAAVIALIARPIVYFFNSRLRIPNQLSVVLTLLLVFASLLGILALFIPIIGQQSENFGRINVAELKGNINALYLQVGNYLGLDSGNFSRGLEGLNLMDILDFQSVPLFMTSIFGKVGSIIVGVFSVIFISFFFLTDSNLLINTFLAFSKPENEGRFERVFHKIKNLLSRYFVGIAIQIAVLFVLYLILLAVFSVPNFVAIAFICAFLNIVPYIGPIIAGALMVFFVGSFHLGQDFSTVILPNMLYVLAGYLVTQIIDNFVNQPLIFGQSVKSHPLEIFLVILIAGILFGVVAMIFAIPCYTALKVVAKEAFSKYRIVKYLTNGL